MDYVERLLYPSDALDAQANWEFWIIYTAFLPDPSSLLCRALFFIPVTHLCHQESSMEREKGKDRRRRQESIMRLIYLPTFWTIVVDFIAWFIIHVGVVLLIIHIPSKSFDSEGWLYRVRRWEKNGDIYTKIFKIRKWKENLPDGSKLLKYKGFPKKRLEEKNQLYFTSFLQETCRAELTHCIIMLFAPLFFLWNKPGVGWIMIFYALIENLPLIMAQRYNRIRFKRLLGRKH